MQGPRGIRGPSVAPVGGTIEIEVGPNTGPVDVNVPGGGVTRHPVDPGSKKAVIPVPPVPAGTMLAISVGRGLRRRVILVEVVDQDE